jgi:hypothetical protein
LKDYPKEAIELVWAYSGMGDRRHPRMILNWVKEKRHDEEKEKEQKKK